MWKLLEQFPRASLHHIGRAAGRPIRSVTYKHDAIEMLCALPEAVLERALAEGLALPDLQQLCRRVGRADTGSKTALAARVLAAVDEPSAQSQRWRPFAEARAFAHRLEFISQKEWYAFARGRLPGKGTLPADIPKSPYQAYEKSGWTTWGDFLGTGHVATRLMTYRPFRQARAYARSLGLAGTAEWQALCRTRGGNRPALPPDIPATPHNIYAGRGWVNYTDWLGTGRVRMSGDQCRSYEDACAFAQALGVRSQSEWYAYCRGELRGRGRRPRDIPSAPDQVYRDRGWVSWGQFLGTNAVANCWRTFCSFAAARTYARKLGLRSRSAWYAASNRPANIPSHPNQAYAEKGWAGWGDFLGTNVVATFRRRFRSFAAARAYARKLGLSSQNAWSSWSAAGNRPADIPCHPERTYAGKGWVSWGDFLGTGNVYPARRRSFAAMRAFVRRLGLRSGSEYRRAKRDGRIPEDIPMEIEQHPEWQGWADFLGPSYTGRPRVTRRARTRDPRG